MQGLSESWACFICRREVPAEKFANGFDFGGFDNLAATLIRHIKDVGDLIDISGNLGNMDRQSQTMQAMSDRKQYADAVFGENLDNREIIGRLVVDVHNRRNFGRVFLGKKPWLGGADQIFDI